MIFPMAVKSGMIPVVLLNSSDEKPKPTMTSSNIRTEPCKVQISLSPSRYPGSGRINPQLAGYGSTMIAAI